MSLSPLYLKRCKERLDTVAPNAWDNLETISSLPADQSVAVVAELLELACAAQHIGNIPDEEVPLLVENERMVPI